MLNHPIFLIAFGLLVGVFSGVMGLGGGSIMIPFMVFGLAMSQTMAHGTSLAVMIPPVVLPAVIQYYKSGNVDLRVAGWMAVGVVCGSLFGAMIATSVSKEMLKLIFGFLLIYVAAYTVFGSQHFVRTLLISAALVAVTAAAYGVTRWIDKPAMHRTHGMSNEI